jgi:putative transposase
MCRVLGVSPSGYYAWRKRGLSRRRREDAALLERVRRIWEGSGRTYGAPRVWAELRACGVRCSRKRVARLMREAGLVGAYPQRRRRKPTVQNPRAAAAPDLVGRQFRAEGPARAVGGGSGLRAHAGRRAVPERGPGRVEPEGRGRTWMESRLPRRSPPDAKFHTS